MALYLLIFKQMVEVKEEKNGYHVKETYSCLYSLKSVIVKFTKITKLNCDIVRDCLQKFTSFQIVIKKPNDIYIKKQKYVEFYRNSFKKKKNMVVGIGINLNKSPKIENYSTNFINFFTKKMLKDYSYSEYYVILMKKK